MTRFRRSSQITAPLVARVSLLIAALAPALAPVPGIAGFFEETEQGWFWYRDPPPAPEESAPEDPAPADPAPAPPAPPEAGPPSLPPGPPPVSPAASDPAGPAPLSTAWFREQLPRYRDAAIDDPTPANLRAYAALERIAGLKAAAFARAKADVTLGNPVLDATAERPVATYGAQALDRAARTASADTLGALAGSVGLLYFFSADCPLCAAQGAVLRTLADTHGLAVMAVSLDGVPPRPDPFAGAWRRDAGQAARLGVDRGPALFLMRPPGALAPLGHGAMDVSDLEARILRVARTRGWISQAAFAATRPVTRRTRDVTLPAIPPEILADPALLADHLERLMTR